MIRPLHPDDAPSLYRLFRQRSSISCDYFDPDAELSSYEAYVELAAIDQHRLVAVEGGHVLGLGVLEQATRARMAHLGRIRLLTPRPALEDATGHQLLSALVDLADNWLNLKRLELNAPSRVPEFGKLLTQFAFEIEGVRRRAIGPGPAYDDEIVYARLNGLDDKEDRKRPPALAPEKRQADDVTVIIRPMEYADAEDLYEVFRAPLVCRTTLQLPSQEIWLTRQRTFDPPVGMIRLVAESDQRVVGMISLIPRRQSRRAHIAGIGMMVHPDYWGLGIGSRLMAAVLDLASQQPRLARVELEVHTDNVAGIGLYQKFGFVIEGTKRFESFGDGGWTNTHFMARLSD
jgi:putative acetyltransferase